MASQNRQDPLATAALLGNGGMGNAMWNNPFIYLVWMMFAGRMFGNNGFGNDGQGNPIQAQLDSLRTQMSDTNNSDLIMSAIRGNDGAIRELAGQLNCDFNSLNGAICDVRGGIDKLAGQVGFSAERVINATQLGDMNIVTALKDCCCSQKELTQSMGYQTQLGLKDLGFGVQHGLCNLGNQVNQGFAVTNTGLERGFSQIGYATQQQTCDIINAGNANTQRIIDTLNCHWQSDLQQRYNDARLELSQLRQNETLISALKTTTTTS
jgi:hypothetical protein